MDINIGENLKRLRKQREITQENLANFLGVSFQAISKWERNEGYPDITILPTIANFFNVTLDELVGMDEIKNTEKITAIRKTLKSNHLDGKIAGNIAILREALQSFPNNYELLAELTIYLTRLQADDETQLKNNKEAIEISERILKFCTDNEIRNDILGNLSYLYSHIGEKEKAIYLAKQLPSIWQCQDVILPDLLNRNEKIVSLQKAIEDLAMLFHLNLKALADVNAHFEIEFTISERIAMLDKSNKIFEIVYDQGDYNFYNVWLAENYRGMAALSLLEGQIEQSISYLEKSVECTIAFDTLPQTVRHTSLLVNKIEYDESTTSKNYSHNWSYLMLNDFLQHDRYNIMRNYPRFMAILEKLRQYAK